MLSASDLRMTTDTHPSGDALRAFIVEALLANGWTANNGPALAMQSFDTAVGVKQAWVYLSRGDGINRTLLPHYESERRNVLEGSCVLIPVGASQSEIQNLVRKFANRVVQVVDASYARKIHLSRIRTAGDLQLPKSLVFQDSNWKPELDATCRLSKITS